MRPTRWRRLRSTLALLLLVLVSTAPAAMTLLAASSAAPTAAHHHAAPGSQHHHHLPAGCCCDVCAASCITCGAIVSSNPSTSLTTPIIDLLDRVASRGRVFDTSSRYLLPPPIGPPS